MSSKYELLANYLGKEDRDMIRMTFDEVEQVIQGELPPSAWKHQAWWSNSESHSHARHGWLYAGYKTSKVNLDAKELIFFRTEPQAMDGNKREIASLQLHHDPRSSRISQDTRLNDVVRSAGGVDNLVQITQAIQQYIDGDLLETELGRILRKLWPRTR